MAVAELTEAQTAAVTGLATALDALSAAVVACRDNGLEPAAAFRAVGIEIPMMAAPVLNMMFRPDPEQEVEPLQ